MRLAELVAWAERNPRRAWFAALLLVLVLTACEASYWPLHDYPFVPWHNKNLSNPTRGDWDAALGHISAARATWSNQLRYWHGHDLHGRQFYRPLTSNLFFTEYRLFGYADRLWSLVSIGIHVVSMLVFSWLVALAAGGPLARRLSLGVGVAYLASGPGLANRELARWTVAWWPAQPDLLSFLFSALSLGCAVMYRESGRFRRGRAGMDHDAAGNVRPGDLLWYAPAGDYRIAPCGAVRIRAHRRLDG